jgi:hypothetical protein
MGMLDELLFYRCGDLRSYMAIAQFVKKGLSGGNCGVLSQLSTADKFTPWRPAEKARTVVSSVAGNTVT